MAQTDTRLLYHIVFSTKNREPWIDPTWRDELHAYIGGIVRNRKGELLAAGGIPDHIHLLVRLAADRSISDVVRDIKSNSSGWLHERGVLPFAWQDGYGAFTLGPSAIPGLTAYISNQVEHHAQESFRDEFVAMLLENEVECDDQRLWM
ncbi:MAG: IS200/IS605 family transposase [Planctomycetia bacterium]|nr:IS200/IS605 family transposase [Planctomycetia bacterium]